MIRTYSDTLDFAFPETDREIHGLLEAHIAETLPYAWKAFPEESARQLDLLRNRGLVDDQWLANAERVLSEVDRGRFEEVYRTRCRSAARLPEKRSRAAVAKLVFYRTLRIPDDGRVYPLPAGFGKFPLRSVDEFKAAIPRSWDEAGGVVMPMYQSEAMWMAFDERYPCAIRITTGAVDALTGQTPEPSLLADPQNYLVVPDQPWLDGFKVEAGIVRQFVAAPLDRGYTASEQLAPGQPAGGMTIEVLPMRASYYFREEIMPRLANMTREVVSKLLPEIPTKDRNFFENRSLFMASPDAGRVEESLGFGAGGRITQEIYEDRYGPKAWEVERATRVALHVCDAVRWTALTREPPPHPPITEEQYREARIPWFLHYRTDLDVLAATAEMGSLKSVEKLGGLAPDGKVAGKSHPSIKRRSTSPVAVRGLPSLTAPPAAFSLLTRLWTRRD